jgi:hypothetical protein
VRSLPYDAQSLKLVGCPDGGFWSVIYCASCAVPRYDEYGNLLDSLGDMTSVRVAFDALTPYRNIRTL